MNRSGSSKPGCLLTLLFASVAIYFGANASEKYWRYLQFKDAMTAEAMFRGSQPNARIIARLRNVADSLGLPEDAGLILIRREGRQITIESHYEETLELPGFSREWHFEPRAVGNY